MKKKSHSTLLLFFCIVIVGFLLRVYKVERPLADWHSWRQADTSSVSRNLLKTNFDIFHPRFDDISNVASGKDNPEGYRFVEFPLYNLLQAGLYKLFGLFSLETWGRLATAGSSVFISVVLFFLVKKYIDVLTALCVSFLYAVLPFSVYYGTSVLPDTSMIMSILMGIYFFDLWVTIRIDSNKNNKREIIGEVFYIFSILFTSSALLLKPYALFFTLPLFFLSWRLYRLRMFVAWRLWVFVLLTVVPLVLWRIWMTQYPEGIPANDWLYNRGDIRFTGAYFYWLFAERIGKLLLGYWGTGLLIVGLLFSQKLIQKKENTIFFLSFLASSLLYLVIIARGNVQHDYYQILILPSIVLFAGIGLRFFLKNPYVELDTFFTKGIGLTVLIATLMFSWYFIRDYYNINNPSIFAAGEAVQKLTPVDAKIVAPYEGDTSLLYHMNRKGWASFQNSLPELIQKGATHLVLVNPTDKDKEIGKTYRVIAEKQEYILFDLKQKP